MPGYPRGSNMKLWLDLAILATEQLLHMLHTISTASYREPDSDASTAAAGAPNCENGLIESEAASV